ncbi:YceI family protein [Fulvivirga sedimenti]|uniref:YceI family protein n=1 Tax=Fulvivirga sedimenti TaxID=2879465 RepID=A0A9X1HLL2_9BACT|nr:YceI family protein [Fulvivirga sedimenti]MCA6073571.1 YceI family protein [Fulvivirga sedimenti]
MKTLTILSICLIITSTAWTQERYFTRTGEISFYSDAPMEKIEALNQQASCIFDKSSGDIAVSLQMRGFKFEKALMEEHFNENYAESHKFPKSTFKGTVDNIQQLDFNKKGKQEVRVKGDLTIHGITKQVTTNGTIEATANGFTINADFSIKLEDYKIEIPSAVIGKIAEDVKISLDMDLSPYTN